MTAVAIATACILALAALLAWIAHLGKRDAAQLANVTALSQAEAQTIRNLKTRKDIDDAVAATDDPHLAALARSVMHHDSAK